MARKVSSRRVPDVNRLSGPGIGNVAKQLWFGSAASVGIRRQIHGCASDTRTSRYRLQERCAHGGQHGAQTHPAETGLLSLPLGLLERCRRTHSIRRPW